MARIHLASLFLLAACGSRGSEAGPDSGSVHFITNTYKVGAAVLSWNPDTGSLSRIHTAEDADWKLFKGKSGLYLLERRASGQDLTSVLARFEGNTPREVGGVAKNAYDMMTGPTGEILVAGWEDGELSRIDPTTLHAATTYVPQALSEKKEDRRFVGLLSHEGTVFAVSGGLDKDYNPTPAKIHRLSSALDKVEETREIQGCRNVADNLANAGFVRISAEKAVVTCNPQWSGAMGEHLAIVLLDAKTQEQRILAEASSSDELGAFFVQGVSREGSHIFVEEMGKQGAAVRQRYWLSLSDGTKIPVSGFGGPFTVAEGRYVFGCVEDCTAKRFALFTEALPTSIAAAKVVDVAYDFAFRGFALPIP